MKILLLSDKTPNSINWLSALNRQPGVEAMLWTMKRTKAPVQIFIYLWSIFQLRFLVRRLRPDIVIGYRTTSYGFLAACTGFRPIVLAAQGESDVWPPGHWSNFFTTKMARFAIRRASLVHAWAQHMAESLYKNGACRKKILVLHRGILLDRFTFQLPFSKKSEINFICTRSLYPEYHHDIILQALKLLEETFTDLTFTDLTFTLCIVGDGMMKNKLMKLVKELQIRSSITWAGYVPTEKIGLWLKNADIYISLPDTEGVSSSLLEAMACGCFPIVTDLPANRQWIRSDKHGKLVQLQVESVLEACKDAIVNRHTLTDGVIQNRKFVEEHADAIRNNEIFVDHYRRIKQCAG